MKTYTNSYTDNGVTYNYNYREFEYTQNSKFAFLFLLFCWFWVSYHSYYESIAFLIVE